MAGGDSQHVLEIKLSEESQGSQKNDPTKDMSLYENYVKPPVSTQTTTSPVMEVEGVLGGIVKEKEEVEAISSEDSSSEKATSSLPDPDFMLPDEEDVRSWWKRIFEALGGFFVDAGEDAFEKVGEDISSLDGGDGPQDLLRAVSGDDYEDDDDDDDVDELEEEDDEEDEEDLSRDISLPAPPSGGSAGSIIRSVGGALASGAHVAGDMLGADAGVPAGAGGGGAAVSSAVGAAGGGGGGMASMMGAVSGAVNPVTMFATALEKTIDVIAKWADFLDDQVEDLKAFNPQLLLATVETDIAMLESRMRRAETTGGFLTMWEEAKRDLMLAFEDLKEVLTVLVVPIMVAIIKQLTFILRILVASLTPLVLLIALIMYILGAILYALDYITGELIPGLTELVDSIFGIVDDILGMLQQDELPPLDELFNAWVNNPILAMGAIADSGPAPRGRNQF